MRNLHTSREGYPAVRSTAADEPTVGRRLLTDGGEEQSADEGSDRTDESDSDESEGGDEEMAPPEQEGEAGVEEGEDEKAEAEKAEAQKEEEEPEETEAEEPKEAEKEPQETAPEEADQEEDVVDIPQSDVESVGATEDESTTVLFVDLYGLDLDVLGLEIELHQLVLDVFATEGDGNLLGNLLSTVGGLADPGGLSNLLPDVSEMTPEGGLSGLLPGGDSIKNAVGLGGGQAGESGAEGDEGEKEGDGFLSSTASTLRNSVPSLPVKQLLIEVIAGVIKQLLEPSENESGEDASGEGS